MTFLPIVSRELRVASRRWGTYWLRSGAALVVILLGVWLFLMLRDEAPRFVSLTLFGVLTGSAVLYALFSGVRATADCLSEEKREGTLGLLFLTDLRGYDVVIGKLVAGSVNAFYAVAAALPMMAIPLLMGGVSLGEFGRMALVILNTLFFSLSLGIGISALSRSGQKARGTTLLLLLLAAGGMPALGGLLSLWDKSGRVLWLFFLPSPGFTFALAFAQNFTPNPDKFWYSLAALNALAWAAIVLACVVAPHSWQDRPADVRRLRWHERWQFWTYGRLDERVTFRQRLLTRNPFFWLTSRLRFKPALVWGVLLVTACVWIWGLAKYRRTWLDPSVYVTTALFLNLTLRCWIAAESSRPLADERRAGTLELLLSTPLSVADILRGQWLALWRQFFAPLATVLVVELVFWYGTFSIAADPDGHWAATCFWWGGMIMLVADCVALYWVGMWQGLIARTSSRAASASLVRIFFCPWVAYGAVVLAMVLWNVARTPQEQDWSWHLLLGLWFVLGLAADVGFALHARRMLLTRFRWAAQDRFAGRMGFWRRLAGSIEPRTTYSTPAVAK
jgi:ABC-type transport system involved in multi-copper enzyme maturation permease subunit